MSEDKIKYNRTKSNILLVIVILLVVINVSIIFFVSNFYHSKKNTYENDFIFNLSSVDFDNNANTYLNGEWEFYYDSLIVSENVENPIMSASLSVPSSWADNVRYNDPFPTGGCASYRSYIKNGGTEKSLKLYIPNLACAYNIFIDGNLVASSGFVSKNPTEVFTSPKNYTAPFILDSDEVYEVVIEVAANDFSGLYISPMIANYDHENMYVETISAIRFCFLGIVFFCSMLTFILRLFINKKIYTNWLPVLLFVLFLRMSITTEMFSVTQSTFFNISYEQMNLFILGFTYIIKLISLSYLFKCLNIKMSNSTACAFSGMFLALAISTIFFTKYVFNPYFFMLYQICSLVIDLYIINKLCIEIVKKTEFSVLYLLSYLFIVSGVTIDTLYTNGFIPYRCSSYMSFLIFIFVLITVIIHAFRIKGLYFYVLQTQKLQAEIENMNNAIMLSQIQPHFLYNALNTIKSLIKKNPEQAENAIIDFSLYLRGNMDSLSKTEPILFGEELKHVQYYCNIEKLRFGDKLDIYYEIDVDNFYVPTLSVQPIVENAIKHGVTKKPEGGSITLSTYEDSEYYYIKIEDDGVGFDINMLNKKDSRRSHVGLENIISRFNKIMNADVAVESVIGKGTTVTVLLPKRSNKKTSIDLGEK